MADVARRIVDSFNHVNGTSIELFAPTFRQTLIRNGREVAIERPLTYHYVFLNAEAEEAKRLCSAGRGFSFVLTPGAEHRHAIVDNQTMAAFRRIAAHYGNELPFFSLYDVDLEEGDKIEIVDGEFAGLTGTYLPRARSNKGNVVISGSGDFAGVIFDVKVEHIRILEFSKTSRRAYDQIDAFAERLRDAKATLDAGNSLTQKQLTSIILFVRRMEKAQLDNHKIEAKLLGLLLAAKRMLGRPGIEIAKLRERFERRRASITNPTTLRLLEELEVMAEIAGRR